MSIDFLVGSKAINNSLGEKLLRLPPEVEEVCLRRGRPASYTAGGKTYPLGYTARAGELDELLKRFTDDSLYAYQATLCRGFLPLPGGYRLGVAGRGVCEGGALVGVTDIMTLCLRFPHRVPGIADEIRRRWETDGGQGGILICGAPGAGKTTMLRELIHTVSETRRTAVLDSRGELCLDGVGKFVTPLSGYPPALGLEIALRTLSPEILVTDELGEEETRGALTAARCGVPLFASAHGTSRDDLLARESLRPLFGAGVFRWTVTLSHEGKERHYTMEKWECSAS